MRQQTSKCQLCKKEIPAGRRLCDLHRQRRPAPGRSIHAPIWDRILAPTANGKSKHIFTTADMLALIDKSLISCTGAEFQDAADLAQAWNKFMAVTA